MIEEVENFRSELEIGALGDPSNFRQGCIEVDKSGPEKSIPPQVTQGAEGLQCKGPRVEPKAVHISSSSRQGTLSCKVRPLARLASRVIQVGLIDSILNAKRSSATGGYNATHLPTFYPIGRL